MSLLLFIVVPVASALGAIAFILYENNVGRYKLTHNSEKVEQKQIDKLKADFPEKDITDLKIEIEKISDMLLDNQESNRYTQKIQERAKRDYKLDEFRDELIDNVQIINYKNGNLKAHVNYENGERQCVLILYMQLVKKGRVFLNNYKTMKRIVS